MMPSKPKTAITVGIGVAPKPKSPLPSGRNPFEDLMRGVTKGGTGSASLSDVAPSSKESVLGGDTSGGLGAKASQDDAGFIAQGQWCGACSNYTRETGDCSKVEGTFQVGDSCKQYFEPIMSGTDDGTGSSDLLAGLGAGKPDETSPTSLT